MVNIKVDVIGGSLGGLSSAISLKENNKKIDVTVHEKHKKIGYNHEGRRCGEAHSVEPAWSKWIPQKKSIFNVIKKGVVHIGNKKYEYYPKKNTAFILNRQEFIRQLGLKANKLGVNIVTNDKIRNVDELEGDYIIDSSGCPSSIKRKITRDKGTKGVTYQQTIENCNAFISDTIKVIYLSDFGYYWIFPRDPDKKEVNLGIGYYKGIDYNLKQKLEEYKTINKIEGKINYVTGGLIPVGLQRPLKYRNILFVGDTGVGAFPITGQGIFRALISGNIAGRCLAQGKPNKYPYYLYRNFIKWDILGKTCVRTCHILKNINPELVLNFFNIFTVSSNNLFF